MKTEKEAESKLKYLRTIVANVEICTVNTQYFKGAIAALEWMLNERGVI